MPQIIAYHPEVVVQMPGGSVVTVEVDMDDWYDSQSVLKKLIRASGGENMGDVVRSIEEGRFNLGVDDGIARVRVRKAVSGQPTIVVGWADDQFNGVG